MKSFTSYKDIYKALQTTEKGITVKLRRHVYQNYSQESIND